MSVRVPIHYYMLKRSKAHGFLVQGQRIRYVFIEHVVFRQAFHGFAGKFNAYFNRHAFVVHRDPRARFSMANCYLGSLKGINLAGSSCF